MENKEKLRSEIDNKYKWDLTRIFTNEKEARKAIDEVKGIQKELLTYKGKIMKSSDNLYNFLKLYDKASVKLEELIVYFIYGTYEMDTTDEGNQKNKDMIDRVVNDFYADMSFIDNEIIKGDYEKLLACDERLLEYKFYLEDLSRNKMHLLTDKEEQLLSSLKKVMDFGYTTYTNMMYTDVDYGKFKDKNGNTIYVNNGNYSKLLTNGDRSIRKKAYEQKYGYYKAFSNTISSSILQSIKESQVLSNIRGFKNSLEQSLFDDNISKKVYDNLIDSVSNNTAYLKRYYEIKNDLLGYKKIYFYDLEMMPKLGIKNSVSYVEAIAKIKDALEILGKDYIDNLDKYLNMNLIDVYSNKGKRNGGYEICLYSKGPFISYNFNGTYKDMLGLAHEIGHAMHSHYSITNQPCRYADYGLLLAEVASLTNEVIVLDYLIEHAKTKNEKIFYLMKQIEEIDHYLFNVVIEVEHEKKLHDAYENNIQMSTNEIMNNYKILKEKYYQSEKLIVTDEVMYSWMRHYQYHVPFYFYKYAIDMIASLVIGKRIIDKEDGFKNKYIKFLSSGKSNYPMELFKELGIDLEDKKIYIEAIEYFNSRVKLLEELLNE